MTGGLKGWLWFVLIVNALAGLASIATALVYPLAWVSVILEVLIVAGAAILLFKQKKIGYYIILAAAVLGLIVNVATGTNIIYAVISAIVMPGIIWLLMKNTWDQFE